MGVAAGVGRVSGVVGVVVGGVYGKGNFYDSTGFSHHLRSADNLESFFFFLNISGGWMGVSVVKTQVQVYQLSKRLGKI